MAPFTHDVKKSKGAAHNNDDIDATCKHALTTKLRDPHLRIPPYLLVHPCCLLSGKYQQGAAEQSRDTGTVRIFVRVSKTSEVKFEFII